LEKDLRTAPADDALERLVFRLEAVKDPRESGKLEKLHDTARGGHELQIAASLPGYAAQSSDEPDARGVDRRYPSQIQNDLGAWIWNLGKNPTGDRTWIRN
jgi:hypothetical protein